MSRRRGGDHGAAAPEGEAARLLDKWTRLAREHVAGGGGCSCGHAGIMLRLQDFEQDILDHLHAKYEAAGDEGVLRLLRNAAGHRAGETGSVSALLRALADGVHGVSTDGEEAALLSDLARSIHSFDRLHRGG